MPSSIKDSTFAISKITCFNYMKKANFLCSLACNKEGANVNSSNVGVISRTCGLIRLMAIVLLLCGTFTMVQAQEIKFVEIVASKTYDDGTQITYFTVTEMPAGQNEIDFIKKYTIDKMDISRLVIFPGKTRCMIDGAEKVDIPEVVSMMNEAAALWRKQNDRASNN